MEKEPITIQGLEKLKKELKFLKEKKRPEIVSAIAEARSHGDLKENAEYHAAREEQSFVEGRIKDIEGKVDRNQFGTIELPAKSPRKFLDINLTTERVQLQSLRRVVDLEFEHFKLKG